MTHICEAVQYSDQMVCKRCELRWDVNDQDPPKCNKLPFLGPATDWAEDCMEWWGKVLTGRKSHWCFDWDGLPVDETCGEMFCCHCFNEPPIANLYARFKAKNRPCNLSSRVRLRKAPF